MYRVQRIPGFRHNAAGCCTTSTLLAIVSLQHIPVEVPDDWLLFQNLGSYTDGVMSEKMRESGNIAQANALFYGTPAPARNARGVSRVNIQSGALPGLISELRKMTGDKCSANVRRDGVSLVGFR